MIVFEKTKQEMAALPQHGVNTIPSRIQINDNILNFCWWVNCPIVAKPIVIVILIDSIVDKVMFLVIIIMIFGDYIFAVVLVHLGIFNIIR